MKVFSKRARRLRDVENQQKIREETKIRTTLIGDEILECARQAIKLNNDYNIKADGSIDESLGKMTTIYLQVNGDSSTIIVVIPSDLSQTIILGLRGFGVYQFDINLSKKDEELHIYNCPCGPEMYLSIDSLAIFKDMMVDRIVSYRHYPSSDI